MAQDSEAVNGVRLDASLEFSIVETFTSLSTGSQTCRGGPEPNVVFPEQTQGDYTVCECGLDIGERALHTPRDFKRQP